MGVPKILFFVNRPFQQKWPWILRYLYVQCPLSLLGSPCPVSRCSCQCRVAHRYPPRLPARFQIALCKTPIPLEWAIWGSRKYYILVYEVLKMLYSGASKQSFCYIGGYILCIGGGGLIFSEKSVWYLGPRIDVKHFCIVFFIKIKKITCPYCSVKS